MLRRKQRRSQKRQPKRRLRKQLKKQNNNYTTIEEYFNYSPYRTFNYILAILDFQNNVFVYFEEDT